METGYLLRDESDYLLEKIGNQMMNNTELIVRRPVFQQGDIDHVCDYNEPKTTLRESVKKTFREFSGKSCMKKLFPIYDWLWTYNWEKNILGDATAGFTVAIMHIPQGMAYAMLGNVPPIIGIYMALFPVLVYIIFGTSRHNSMGTFAVVCMMTGKVVLTHSSSSFSQANSTSVTILNSTGNYQYSPTEVATAVTFGVAFIQLAMYVLHLGVISSLLSETLVSGFTTAAAVQVFTSQVKDLLGLDLPSRRGILTVIYTYYDMFNAIDDVNVTAMVISAITIIVVIFNNEVLKPRIAKLCAFPLPIEMMAVVSGTLISMQMNLSGSFNVATVGHISIGLPVPSIPPIDLLPSIMIDCFVITMVSYSISMSMALTFAHEMNYEIDSNQELMAQGLGNLTGSFFSCMPFAASLSRSLIQKSVGGKTQLASLISCFFLIFVLLWVGPYLEPLPKCVLAGIIVVALKGMLLQVKDLFKFWRLSSTDAILWVFTFFGVIILDIEYGLLIGAIFCFFKLMLLSIRPYTCRLALFPGTELYLDTSRYKKTVDIPGIKIFHYCGGLNFATKMHFRRELFRVTEFNPQEERSRQFNESSKKTISEQMENFRVLIIDFSALIHIDQNGVRTLHGLLNDYMRIGISLYLSGCSGPIFETIRKFNKVVRNETFMLFPTVSDAVIYAKHENVIPPVAFPSAPFCATTYQIQNNGENCISRL